MTWNIPAKSPLTGFGRSGEAEKTQRSIIRIFPGGWKAWWNRWSGETQNPPPRWTCKSVRLLAEELSKEGIARWTSDGCGTVTPTGIHLAIKPKMYQRRGAWHEGKKPVRVKDHDFPGPDVPYAHPYRIYDLKRNEGFVNVGKDHDTA
jgi:hypothetical protein